MADEAKEPTKAEGPSLFTMFAVAVAGGLTVHLVAKYFERRPAPQALPSSDPWDFEG